MADFWKIGEYDTICMIQYILPTLLTKPSVYIKKYREISQLRDVKDSIYYMDGNNIK